MTLSTVRIRSAPDEVVELPTALPASAATIDPEVSLLGGFAVAVGGRRVAMSESSQRVLAFIALRDRPVTRAVVAGTLWTDHTDARAAANLRSALWRLNQCGVELVDSVGRTLQLSPQVRVDVRELMGVWTQLRAQGADAEVVDAIAPGAMAEELLPDWYDDWVIVERERLRQLRLHLLDSMCLQLTVRGLYFEAIDVGLMAVAAEPLRESAHRAVIEAHLAERNVGEARRQYISYAKLLRESGCGTPSPSLTQLLRASGCEVAPLD